MLYPHKRFWFGWSEVSLPDCLILVIFGVYRRRGTVVDTLEHFVLLSPLKSMINQYLVDYIFLILYVTGLLFGSDLPALFNTLLQTEF